MRGEGTVSTQHILDARGVSRTPVFVFAHMAVILTPAALLSIPAQAQCSDSRRARIRNKDCGWPTCAQPAEAGPVVKTVF